MAARGHAPSLEPVGAKVCFAKAKRSEGRAVTFSTLAVSAGIAWPMSADRSRSGSKRRPDEAGNECQEPPLGALKFDVLVTESTSPT